MKHARLRQIRSILDKRCVVADSRASTAPPHAARGARSPADQQREKMVSRGTLCPLERWGTLREGERLSNGLKTPAALCAPSFDAAHGACRVSEPEGRKAAKCCAAASIPLSPVNFLQPGCPNLSRCFTFATKDAPPVCFLTSQQFLLTLSIFSARRGNYARNSDFNGPQKILLGS